MQQPVWSSVRRDVGFKPLTEGRIGGDNPLYVERWVYQARQVKVSGVPCPVLITHLGGAQVREGGEHRWRFTSLPSQSLLLPPRTSTRWHYSGPVDDVAFYLLDPQEGIERNLADLVSNHGAPMQFSDPLVAAAAQQLVDELHSGPSADGQFMALLARLMLEQVFRVLTGSNAQAIHPQHVHFSRLERVLRHIGEHLAESLPSHRLAALAGVSESHFRRMFVEAVGVPPHRYVQGRRLAQARRLLVMSALPIPVIADECGFYSQSHLTKCFQATHAITPAAYRRQVKRAAALPPGRNALRARTRRSASSRSSC